MRRAKEIMDDIQDLLDEYAEVTGQTIDSIKVHWLKSTTAPPIVRHMFTESSRPRDGYSK